MQLASNSVLPQPPLAAMPQLSEKPRMGFESKKTAWNPGPNVCNFTVTLGLQVAVVENGVRKTYSARYYNAATGRFLSRDPLDGNAIDPKTLHKYLYAGGNPVDKVDPSGKGMVEYEDQMMVQTRNTIAELKLRQEIRYVMCVAGLSLLLDVDNMPAFAGYDTMKRIQQICKAGTGGLN